ncbi:glycosyltransferase [bacterium]|nr:glycosyltransferase [bacterium]
MDSPLVSIIIPVRNGERELARCLRAIERLERLDEAEVLVVDNGSTDGTMDVAAGFEFVRVLEEPKPGPACARNLGAREARGEFLAFTDADCEPDPRWLADLLPHLEKDEFLGGIGGTIVAGETTALPALYIDWRKLYRAEQMFWDQPYSPPFFMTANAIYRRAAYEQVGGFTEELWPCEDADFSWRVAWAGWKLLQLPDRGRVVHYHRETVRAFARMMYFYGWGGGVLFARHRERFGGRHWVEWATYWRLLKGIAKIPICPVVFRDPLQKRRGLFDTILYASFIAGRWRAAIRNKVLIL